MSPLTSRQNVEVHVNANINADAVQVSDVSLVAVLKTIQQSTPAPSPVDLFKIDLSVVSNSIKLPNYHMQIFESRKTVLI